MAQKVKDTTFFVAMAALVSVLVGGVAVPKCQADQACRHACFPQVHMYHPHADASACFCNDGENWIQQPMDDKEQD